MGKKLGRSSNKQSTSNKTENSGNSNSNNMSKSEVSSPPATSPTTVANLVCEWESKPLMVTMHVDSKVMQLRQLAANRISEQIGRLVDSSVVSLFVQGTMIDDGTSVKDLLNAFPGNTQGLAEHRIKIVNTHIHINHSTGINVNSTNNVNSQNGGIGISDLHYPPIDHSQEVCLQSGSLQWKKVRYDGLASGESRVRLLLMDNSNSSSSSSNVFDGGYGEVHNCCSLKRIGENTYERINMKVEVVSVRHRTVETRSGGRKLDGPQYTHAGTHAPQDGWIRINCPDDEENAYFVRGLEAVEAKLINAAEVYNVGYSQRFAQELGSNMNNSNRELPVMRKVLLLMGQRFKASLGFELQNDDELGPRGKLLNRAIYGEVRKCYRLQPNVNSAVGVSDSYFLNPDNVVAIKTIEHMHNHAVPISTKQIDGNSYHNENPLQEIENTIILGNVMNPKTNQFGHSNVMTIQHLFADLYNIYSVMPFANGGDLFDVLFNGGGTRFHQMSELHVNACMKQVMSGLHFIHFAGLVHLDISIENVLIHYPNPNSRNPTERIYVLTDLGQSIILTRRKPSESHSGLNNHNNILRSSHDKAYEFLPSRASNRTPGKPDYYCPEVFSPSSLAPRPFSGARVDLWQAAMMMLVMITGNKPFAEIDRTYRHFLGKGYFAESISSFYSLVGSGRLVSAPFTAYAINQNNQINEEEFGRDLFHTTLEQLVSPEAVRVLIDLLKVNPEERVDLDKLLGGEYQWFN